KANDLKLQKIAFTEHVRSTSDWTEKYLEELKQFEKSTDIKILKGFEAKILPDGNVDCLSEYLNKNYFIIASFHTKYYEKEKWLNALIKAIRNENVNVIGHLAPEPEFSLDSKELSILSEEIYSNDKIIELNAKYKRPPMEFIKVFKDKGVKFHLGSDAHSLNQIGNFNGIKNLINFIEHSEE
ncbi:MAG: hypothetical protein ACTHJ2_03895, partial [Candidatus Nitrosocosmicus sp.]